MFYEMCFTGLVYFSGTWMFIYYFCVNNTTTKIQQHQNWGKGLGERLKNSRIMLERGVQMDFTLKDILKAFNNFKNKQQKCMK